MKTIKFQSNKIFIAIIFKEAYTPKWHPYFTLIKYEGVILFMNKEMYELIKNLADIYAKELKQQVVARVDEMKSDDNSHFLIYRILGVSDEEGNLIDLYQNKGRFLYKYAGAFLEEAAIICFKYKYSNAQKIKIPNTTGSKPKTFEIDCLVNQDAHEIKWRDATTDGDHITKEHTRVKTIKNKGYTPIRIMFYYPQREQAKRIQETLKDLYKGIGGQYYYGDSAWEYIKSYTGIDLLEILEKIAISRNNS